MELKVAANVSRFQTGLGLQHPAMDPEASTRKLMSDPALRANLSARISPFSTYTSLQGPPH